ncbi:SLIT-ROBO Rho GTPase-activating protein 1-like [Aricia agestis]|uniref:SLIT-ROBO Rho GTPase-activating protein 1-like n=1 Tax=Aricia agestis TaxID=91739 RepID=UPI001C207C89|nr:SLIT-ROBO Rho GTPase-activating protein 1-like [Aricia agestis]
MFQCVQPRTDWAASDLANAFPDIRVQLSEQTRLLEARAEAAAGAAGELHDYCRRRAELEHEYARALDKLARAAAARHRDPRAPPPPAARAVWAAALEHTRALARDHAALADLYGAALAPRLQRAADDVLRLHRRCRDVLHERHEEVAAALAEAAAGGKAHAAAAADWRAAALKLRTAHAAREALAADPPRHKKLKALDKELDKRRARHSEARARALRARADYQLSLEAANATLQRYYLDDVADIMMCTEVGYEAVVGRSARAAGGAEAAAGAAAAGAAQALLSAADALDALADRQRFVAAHPHAFSPPRPLPFAGDPPPDHDRAMSELLAGAAPDTDDAAAAAADDLAARLRQLESAARALRAECAENAKTLDAAEAELLRLVEGPAAQWEVAGLFGSRAAPAPPAAPTPAPADDDARRDQEDYYLQKFRAYVSSAGRLARVEARAAAARGGGGAGAGRARSPPRRAARARSHFAAPLGAELPAVLVSCVRVIAAYGVRQQGVFRVSGSASETAALRAAYCRGEDPLAAARGPPDVNAVCGLLKQYVRELRPPLLPPRLQEPLCRCAALPQPQFARRVRELLGGLPPGALLALRYLFAFLAHLAEHASTTMMDAWNLAICLGPTLMAAWGEGGAQVHAQNLVNELVKRTIEHHLEIFPQDVAPHALFVPPPPPPHEESDEADGADGAEPADEAGAESGAGAAGGGVVAGNGWDATADLQRYVDDNDADLAALTDTDDDPDDRASGEDEQVAVVAVVARVAAPRPRPQLTQ